MRDSPHLIFMGWSRDGVLPLTHPISCLWVSERVWGTGKNSYFIIDRQGKETWCRRQIGLGKKIHFPLENCLSFSGYRYECYQCYLGKCLETRQSNSLLYNIGTENQTPTRSPQLWHFYFCAQRNCPYTQAFWSLVTPWLLSWQLFSSVHKATSHRSVTVWFEISRLSTSRPYTISGAHYQVHNFTLWLREIGPHNNHPGKQASVTRPMNEHKGLATPELR